MVMSSCIDCGRPCRGSRCEEDTRKHELERRRSGKGRAYLDPEYRRFRDWVKKTRPPCHLCGLTGADSVDHLVALAAGGLNVRSNWAPAHLKPILGVCPGNLGKGAR